MLQAEEIKQNWDTFLSIIEDHITGERKDKLLEFYKQYEDRFVGKFGTLDQPSVFDNDNDWEIKNRGELYKFNTNITYMSVPDRSLHLLFSIGVTMSENEYIAIKTHDGMYDDANKSYLLSYMPETKPRSSLLYVLHQADMMAARIEYETEWLPKLMSGKSSKPTPKKEFTLNKSGQSAQKQKALKTMGNDNLANILKNI